jgi:hypothetical protein
MASDNNEIQIRDLSREFSDNEYKFLYSLSKNDLNNFGDNYKYCVCINYLEFIEIAKKGIHNLFEKKLSSSNIVKLEKSKPYNVFSGSVQYKKDYSRTSIEFKDRTIEINQSEPDKSYFVNGFIKDY